MREIRLKEKARPVLQQIVDNSEPIVREALIIARAKYDEFYLLQNQNVLQEPLALSLDKKGRQLMVIKSKDKIMKNKGYAGSHYNGWRATLIRGFIAIVVFNAVVVCLSSAID